MNVAFLATVLLVVFGPPFTGYAFVWSLAPACQGSVFGVPACQVIRLLIQMRMCFDIAAAIGGSAVLAVLLARHFRNRAIKKEEPCVCSESA